MASSGNLANVMVAEPSDPTANFSLAPAMADGASRPASQTSSLGPPIGDLELSEDSFADTPPKQRPRSISKPGQKPRPGSRRRMVMTVPRAASTGVKQVRGMARPPSPAMEAPKLKEHRVFTAPDKSVEARLASLELQQSTDHGYFTEIKQAFIDIAQSLERQGNKHLQLQTAQTEHTQMGVNLRREIYEIRDKMANEMKRVLPELLKQSLQGDIGQVIEKKVSAIEESIAKLQGAMASNTDREQAMAKYLEDLHGQRPQEGQAVLETFRRVDQEIGNVKAKIQQFEKFQPSAAAVEPPFNSSAVLTKENLEQLNVMYRKLDFFEGMQQEIATTKALAESLGNGCADLTRRVLTLEEDYGGRDVGSCGHAHPPGIGCGGAGVGLNLVGAFNGTAALPPGTPAGSAGGWAHGGAAGGAGQSHGGGGAPSWNDGRIQAIIGGNNICHCVHVAELIGKVAVLEGRAQGRGTDPWHGAAGGGPFRPPSATAAPEAKGTKKTLPLTLPGPLGAIDRKDRSIFDEKLTLQAEYKFDGIKGGIAWKGKLERYFISKAPILKELLEWAESEDMETVTVDMFKQAVGTRMTDTQVLTVNAELWGFLSGALSGTAETMFKRAETLNGLDAWRRMARFVDNGRAIRLETLRREVKTMHLRPIKNLEAVNEGIAEFENLIAEYEQAGGTPFQDLELKADLLAIIPSELRENLLRQASDSEPFSKFRDMVINQAAKVMLNRKKLPIHNIDAEPARTRDAPADDSGFDFNEITTVDELLAMINGKFGRRRFQDRRANANGSGNEARGKRKCPNCGKEHAALKCPEPPVPKEKRLCFGCLKPGHSVRDCPEKKSGIKAIEDGKADFPFFGLGLVDDEGFKTVKWKRRPAPRAATLGDFLRNSFNCLMEPEDQCQAPSRSATASPSPSISKVAEKISRSVESGTRSWRHVLAANPGDGYNRKLDLPQGLGRHSPGTTTAQRAHPGHGSGAHNPGTTAQRAHPGHSSGAKTSKLQVDELDMLLKKQIQEAEAWLVDEEEHGQDVDLVIEPEEELIGAATEQVTIAVAVDSGAVANVIGPDELPVDAELVDDAQGRHYVDAQGGSIRRYGTFDSKLVGNRGEVGCRWQVADVTKPLHSLSMIAGPKEGPGEQDILFNNKMCYVVKPGVVERIMKELTAVAEYERKGNLYVADMVMSSFPRQGPRP